jgi:hypothetical protein
MKIVINRCYGGFELSERALKELKSLGFDGHYSFVDRADERLISVVESLGSDASSSCSKLRIVEIPDGVDYYITDYDGVETICERHRTWTA